MVGIEKIIPETAAGALFGLKPERANLRKNAPKRSEFAEAGTVLAFSLFLP
jgi:hypothetical protein